MNDTQRALVDTKYELLRLASFGFTEDRLLQIQNENAKEWTDECVGELREKIAAAAPSHVSITLLHFRSLRCISLQCLPAPTAGSPATLRTRH